MLKEYKKGLIEKTVSNGIVPLPAVSDDDWLHKKDRKEVILKLKINRDKFQRGVLSEIDERVPSLEYVDEYPEDSNYVYVCEVKKEEVTELKRVVKKYEGIEIG